MDAMDATNAMDAMADMDVMDATDAVDAMVAMDAMYAMDATYMMYPCTDELPVRKQWDSSRLEVVSNIHIYSSIRMKRLD